GHHDAVRVVHRERLRVLASPGAHRRVTDVAHGERPTQTLDVRGAEDVADEPLALLHVEASVVRDDPRGVLPAVLHRDEAVIDLADRVFHSDHTDEAAHTPRLPFGTRRHRTIPPPNPCSLVGSTHPDSVLAARGVDARRSVAAPTCSARLAAFCGG